MLFYFNPVREADNATENMCVALVVETPGQPETASEVMQFFSAIDSSLTSLANGGYQVAIFRVVLSSPGGLASPSCFIDVLCTFLRGRYFVIAQDRTTARPLCLRICLSEDFAVARSNGITADSTSMICRAFWENETVRATPFVAMDLPTSPSQEMIRTLIVENGGPHVQLRVSDTPGAQSFEHNVAQIHFENDNCFTAIGASHVEMIAKRVLKVMNSPKILSVRLVVYTARVASVVAEKLRSHRNHVYRSLLFATGEPAHVVDTNVAERLPPIDGADLCAAALLCPAVRKVSFQNFQFSAAAVSAANEALATSTGARTAALLDTLFFASCDFAKHQPQPATARDDGGHERVIGICDLVMTVSSPSALQNLILFGTKLEISDLKTLCTMLTGSECSIRFLVVGGKPHGGASFLRGDGVLHFFDRLRFMTTLKQIEFYYVVPAFMSQHILNGIKNNYSLVELRELTFEADGPTSLLEISAYLTANARGRGTFATAVKYPEDHAVQDEALKVLHRLSNSNEKEDETTRFLCLLLLLPEYCARSLDRGR
jgi:hypothetical protein